MGWRPNSNPKTLKHDPPPPFLPPTLNPQDFDSFTIPQLISFLQSSYKKSDFEMVQRILISRENQTRRGFSEELSSKEAEKLELEKSLGDVRTKCSRLEEEARNSMDGTYSSNVGKIFESFAKRRLEHEVSLWKSKCEELQARVSRLDREEKKSKGKGLAAVGVIEISDDDEVFVKCE